MQFNLYATFRLLAGKKHLTLDLPPGISVRQAIDAVIEQLPVIRSHWLDEHGELYAHVHVFINGEDIQNMPEGIETPLQPEDVLDFFPPVGGGAVKRVYLLAMHGAPPADFPAAELGEFFSLHARFETAPHSLPPAARERYAVLDSRMRDWPRTPANDPFFAGANDLADALRRETGCQVFLGYNEFCSPSLDAALDQAAAAGADEVVVLTVMLTRGGEHSEVEIPAAVDAAAKRHPQARFRYVWPVDSALTARFLAGLAG
jgi:sirohydrochlorin cobaltochelatase